jgi:hypothetical protein
VNAIFLGDIERVQLWCAIGQQQRACPLASLRLAAYPVRRYEHFASEILAENGNDVCCLVNCSVNWEILEIKEGKAKQNKASALQTPCLVPIGMSKCTNGTFICTW